jgi:hypothetical protein
MMFSKALKINMNFFHVNVLNLLLLKKIVLTVPLTLVLVRMGLLRSFVTVFLSREWLTRYFSISCTNKSQVFRSISSRPNAGHLYYFSSTVNHRYRKIFRLTVRSIDGGEGGGLFWGVSLPIPLSPSRIHNRSCISFPVQ